MIALLPRNMLIPFLSKISQKMEVIAPVLIQGTPAFCTWTGQDLALEENPLHPPTEFLLPQKRHCSDMCRRVAGIPLRRNRPCPD